MDGEHGLPFAFLFLNIVLSTRGVSRRRIRRCGVCNVTQWYIYTRERVFL